jgi:hypothetical protein
MKPILTTEARKSRQAQAYELNTTLDLLPVENSKVIRRVVDEETNEVKSVTVIGVYDELFIIQKAEERFGGDVILKEGLIPSLINKKLHNEVAEYVGETLNSIMPMEYLSDINAYKGHYVYNNEKVTVYYSGANSDFIWLSGKPFKDEEYTTIEREEKDNITKHFKFK